jgi:CheY-like chemotaxis protein
MLQQQQQQHLIQQYKHYSLTSVKRILIVNYEDDVNFALKLVLEQEKACEDGVADRKSRFKVDCLNNPYSTLQSFKNGLYDLIIIGVMMPGMNGFELSKKLRRIDENVKICFLTAGDIPSNFRGYAPSYTAGRGGGEEKQHDKFITLPIENKNLLEHLEGILN